MRILTHIVRKFGDADELHIVGGQTLMPMIRRVDVGGGVEFEHRHIVDAAGPGEITKMHHAGKCVLDRCEPQTRAPAHDTAAQRKAQCRRQ